MKPKIINPVFFLGSLILVFIALFGSLFFSNLFIVFFVYLVKTQETTISDNERGSTGPLNK